MTSLSAGDAPQKTVLIVEDSRTQGLRLKSVLENEGLQVLLARSGREGLDMALRNKPDAIILDLEMPDMNGFQVCERLKARPETGEIPIIMLTRFDDNLVASRGLESGAIEFIPKDVFADAVLLESFRQMGLIFERPVE
jgi:CheY-like chemotaxis protein